MTLQTPAFLVQLTVYAHVLGSVRIVCRAGSMQLSGVRLSMSVWVSVPSGRWTPLLQVCCCGSGGHEISVDCCSSGLRRANVGSATLSAYVVAEQTCYISTFIVVFCCCTPCTSSLRMIQCSVFSRLCWFGEPRAHCGWLYWRSNAMWINSVRTTIALLMATQQCA